MTTEQSEIKEFKLWAPVVGYENEYAVSQLGEISSLLYKNPQGIFERKKIKILKPNVNKAGYITYMIGSQKNKMARRKLIHRIVAESFIDNPENKPCVNHIDGNKSNNCVDNLEWVTQSENEKHAHSAGLKNFLKRHRANSKLTQVDIDTIRLIKGSDAKSIAETYGVSIITIKRILSYETWR